MGGYGSDKAAVGEAARSNPNRFEQSRVGATCANGSNQRALTKDDGIAGSEVSSDDRQGNLHVLEVRGVEDAFDQIAEAMVAGETKAGDAPAGEIAKANGAANSEYASEWRATGVGCAKNAAHAGSCDVRNGDVVLFENFENAQMSKAAREAAAKRQANALPWHCRLRLSLNGSHHGSSVRVPIYTAQWNVSWGFPVRQYRLRICSVMLALIQNSTEILVPYPLCTIVRSRREFHDDSRRRQSSEGGAMDTAYQPWIGQAVVLQVALGELKVPLRGRLLKDAGETLRMRIGDGWDIDIYKAMVMAVEEDAMALIPA